MWKRQQELNASLLGQQISRMRPFECVVGGGQSRYDQNECAATLLVGRIVCEEYSGNVSLCWLDWVPQHKPIYVAVGLALMANCLLCAKRFTFGIFNKVAEHIIWWLYNNICFIPCIKKSNILILLWYIMKAMFLIYCNIYSICCL